MKLRALWRRFAVIAALVSAAYVAFFLVLVVVTWLLPGERRPTDGALAASFKTNRVVFEELRDLMQANPRLGRISPSIINRTNSYVDSSPAAVGVSKDQHARYLDLLRKANATSAIHENGEFRFMVSAWGWVDSGWRIAVVYCTNSPSPVIASLDDFHKTKSEWEHAYRPLGDDWYMWIIW